MTPKDTNADKPEPEPPNYERIAAEMMQQWQQQFVQPVTGPELAETLGKSGLVAQNMLEMGQVLWQSWLQPKAEGEAQADASSVKTAYTTPDADAPLHDSHAATAAAAVHGAAGSAARFETGVQPDTTPAASMASVALCAELARRLDLLSQRVWQLEQQILNRK